MDEVLEAQCEKLAITRKLTATMREVWQMQPKFEQRSGQRPWRLIELPRFRMAYDFLALRAASGEVSPELESWWRTFQDTDDETRRAMLVADSSPAKKRRRRRRGRKPGGGDDTGAPPPA
jgi:poly(A) polymerase